MSRLGKVLKADWMELPSKMFESSTFGDLRVGEKFIALPLPGDNSGHGGFKGKSWIFQRVRRSKGSDRNALRLKDGVLCSNPDSMPVLRVE